MGDSGWRVDALGGMDTYVTACAVCVAVLRTSVSGTRERRKTKKRGVVPARSTGLGALSMVAGRCVCACV